MPCRAAKHARAHPSVAPARITTRQLQRLARAVLLPSGGERPAQESASPCCQAAYKLARIWQRFFAGVTAASRHWTGAGTPTSNEVHTAPWESHGVQSDEETACERPPRLVGASRVENSVIPSFDMPVPSDRIITGAKAHQCRVAV